MSFRPFPLAFVVVALCAPTLQVVRADAPLTPNTAPPAQTPDEGRPRRGGGDGPREGGFGEGGPREGGPREGGPRGEGRGEGGPRGGGPGGRGPGGPGGPRGGGNGGPMLEPPRPDETPEQFHERALAPYLEILPDLNDAQKTHILAILDAAVAEMNAARQNQTLSQQKLRAAIFYVRGDISNRVMYALTDEQIATFNQYRAQQQATMAAMDKVGGVRPDEDVEQMRARVLVGYEDVMEELSVKQKTEIIKILAAAGEEAEAIKADTARSDADKLTALRKVHDDVSTKVLPLLDADQAAVWKKAHAAKRP